MENIFAALMEAQRIAQDVSPMLGRSYGVTVGIVTDREDPEGYGRVKAALPAKGGHSATDWLWRVPGMPGLSPVSPRVGDSVWILFKDGDPHTGMYLGVTQNRPNPAWSDKDGVRVVVGSVVLTIGSDSVVTITGAKEINAQGTLVNLLGSTMINLVTPELNLAVGNIAVTGYPGSTDRPGVAIDADLRIQNADHVSINGKQVLTIGSIDDEDDVSVTKGW